MPGPSLEGLWLAFTLGLASASSPCLLPLYPAFIAYLGANAQVLEGRRATGVLGLIVLAGVLTTMTLASLVLVAVAIPTSRLLVYVTPLVDGLLIALGALLIVGRNPFYRLPAVRVPVLANPFGQAYVYGVLLGPLAFPCAGPFLVSLLAISVGIADAAGRLSTFLVFGLGFGLPLVLLSVLAASGGQAVIQSLVARHRWIEVGSGALLIGAATFDLVDKWDSIRLTLGL